MSFTMTSYCTCIAYIYSLVDLVVSFTEDYGLLKYSMTPSIRFFTFLFLLFLVCNHNNWREFMSSQLNSHISYASILVTRFLKPAGNYLAIVCHHKFCLCTSVTCVDDGKQAAGGRRYLLWPAWSTEARSREATTRDDQAAGKREEIEMLCQPLLTGVCNTVAKNSITVDRLEDIILFILQLCYAATLKTFTGCAYAISHYSNHNSHKK